MVAYKYEGIFKLDATASIWMRKTRRAGFRVLEHIDYMLINRGIHTGRVIFFIQKLRRRFHIDTSSLNRP